MRRRYEENGRSVGKPDVKTEKGEENDLSCPRRNLEVQKKHNKILR